MASNKILNVPPQFVPAAVGNLLAGGIAAPAPNQNAATTITTGGSLAAATYFYVVTALVTRPDGTTGETIASNERSVTTTGTTSTNTITWGSVAGATGYKVYRGTGAGLENVFYSPGNVLTFADTGAASTGGTPPAINSAIYLFVPGNTGFNLTQAYLLIKHIRVTNNDNTNAHTVKLFKGASGGSAPGTEVVWAGGAVIPNAAAGNSNWLDWNGSLRLDALDFLTGLADTASKITIEIDGEIGFSG